MERRRVAASLGSIGLLAALAVLLVGSLGCLKSYCVRRSAIVPVPAPSMRPAAMAEGVVEGGVGSDAVIWARPPRRLADRNVGLYVSRAQLAGYLTFSWHPSVSLGLSWETGLAQGAVPISEGLVDPPGRGVGGAGPHLSLHFPVGRRLVLDVGCDAWIYGIPSSILYTEGSSCEAETSPSHAEGNWASRSADSVTFVGRAWLALGADLGWCHLTAGVGVRNHPTNVEVSEEEHSSPEEISPRIYHVAYPYVHLAWEIHIQPWAHISLGVYQPLWFDPVIYAPVVGASLRLGPPARSS